MDRKNIDKITDNQDERILLAKVWDKINAGFQKCIPAHTGFLSPHQMQLAQYLFGNQEGLCSYGGYPDAERQMFIYLPEYLTEEYLKSDDSPLVCLRASYYKDDNLTHRDILGALIGCGIAREAIGDILMNDHSCDFFITAEIAPFILENFQSAGRVSLKISQISLDDACIPEQKYVEMSDTVASLRLDSIISSGFRISRTAAGSYIEADKAAVDGLVCAKPDKIISQGSKISVRGLGKIMLFQVGHTTKKGRISVIIHRYQ